MTSEDTTLKLAEASGARAARHAGFAASWVTGQARELGPGAAVMLLIREGDGVLRPQGRAPSDWTPEEGLRAAVAAAAEHGRPATRPLGDARLAIALALTVPDAGMAVAGAVVQAATPQEGQAALSRLAWGLAGVEAYLRRQDMPVTAAPADEGAARALRLVLRALETPGYRDAARTAATELALVLGADRVSVARARRSGARIEALSHVAEVAGRSRIRDRLKAAADAALDQSDLLLWPAPPDAPPRNRHALADLARDSGTAAVVALPIGAPERPWGALVAEFANVDAAQAALPVLDVAGDALAPLLEVKRRDDRLWVVRGWEGLTSGLATLLGPKALGWKLAALTLAGLGVAAATVTAPARVTAKAEIASDDRVVIAAPFDGFLSERLVRAGDAVTAGQVLARLDTRELSLDLLRQEAARRQKEIERDAAVAANDRAQLTVLGAEIAEVEAETALTRARLEAADLRAPFDGVVTLDAAEGRLGAPLRRGDDLFTVAPGRQRSLTLFAPDASVDRLAVGQAGQLRLEAMPDRPLSFTVTRLTPMTETRAGENTFRVHADLTGDVPPDLGIGMQGVGKIVTGRDLWVLTWGRPLVESLRLKLWSFWP